MSTLQHKQVKSQKQHLKILGAGGPRGRGPRADIWGRGPRKTNTPKNNVIKYEQNVNGVVNKQKAKPLLEEQLMLFKTECFTSFDFT